MSSWSSRPIFLFGLWRISTNDNRNENERVHPPLWTNHHKQYQCRDDSPYWRSLLFIWCRLDSIRNQEPTVPLQLSNSLAPPSTDKRGITLNRKHTRWKAQAMICPRFSNSFLQNLEWAFHLSLFPSFPWSIVPSSTNISVSWISTVSTTPFLPTVAKALPHTG